MREEEMRARVREDERRGEKEDKKRRYNVMCTEFQFAGSTPQRRDVRGGRGVLMHAGR